MHGHLHDLLSRLDRLVACERSSPVAWDTLQNIEDCAQRLVSEAAAVGGSRTLPSARNTPGPGKLGEELS